MDHRQVFGALRAVSVASLCAGAALAVASCGEPKSGTETQPAAKTGPAAPNAKSGAEKPAGEKSCGGDKGCSPSSCSANVKKSK